MSQKILRILIGILTLADGALHFTLDFVLFRGNLFGNPFAGGPPIGSPPPGSPPRVGGPPPLPLPLNQLFVLNFIGAVILALLYWFSPRWLGAKRWLVNAAIILYEALTFGGWWLFGKPNPMNLGYLSKGIEIVLVIVLVVDLWKIFQSRNAW